MQEPVEALKHLAIKGYCSCSCDAVDPAHSACVPYIGAKGPERRPPLPRLSAIELLLTAVCCGFLKKRPSSFLLSATWQFSHFFWPAGLLCGDLAFASEHAVCVSPPGLPSGFFWILVDHTLHVFAHVWFCRGRPPPLRTFGLRPDASALHVPTPNRWAGLGYSSSYRPYSPSLPEHPLLPPVPRPGLRSSLPLNSLNLPATQCKHSGHVLIPRPPEASRPPLRLPSDAAPSSVCTAFLLDQAVSVLGREWLGFLSDLCNDSDLFAEASQSANPQVLMLRVVQRFAPSTLERYFAEWRLWLDHCAAAQASPARPLPGLLPDWLQSRASQQGLAMGPIRALTCFGKQAGLPHLLAAVHSPVVRSFLTPTNPSERRDGLPLPLSVVAWLERLVMNLITTPCGCSVLWCAPDMHLGFTALG